MGYMHSQKKAHYERLCFDCMINFGFHQFFAMFFVDPFQIFFRQGTMLYVRWVSLNIASSLDWFPLLASIPGRRGGGGRLGSFRR